MLENQQKEKFLVHKINERRNSEWEEWKSNFLSIYVCFAAIDSSSSSSLSWSNLICTMKVLCAFQDFYFISLEVQHEHKGYSIIPTEIIYNMITEVSSRYE